MNGRFRGFRRFGLVVGAHVALVLVLCACSATTGRPKVEPPLPPRPLPEPGPPPWRGGDGNGRPTLHAWELLTEMDSEKPGYGMYTYVLFGRGVRPPNLPAAEILARYNSLLTAIAASTPAAGAMKDVPVEEINVFLIPALAAGMDPSLPNYNPTIAMRYVAMFARVARKRDPDLADRLTSGAGPFLISTPQPSGQIGSGEVALLYADLSSTNPAAMGEVVAAYKVRVGRRAVTDVERYAPLRLALLNVVLNADDNVKLVRAAFGAWIP